MPGVGQSCDRNRFEGTFAELLKLTFGGVKAPEKATTKPKPDSKKKSKPRRAEGDADLSVQDIQEILRKVGWPLKADGAMGGTTFSAIKDFQRGFAWWDLLIDGNPARRPRRRCGTQQSTMAAALCTSSLRSSSPRGMVGSGCTGHW